MVLVSKFDFREDGKPPGILSKIGIGEYVNVDFLKPTVFWPVEWCGLMCKLSPHIRLADHKWLFPLSQLNME